MRSSSGMRFPLLLFALPLTKSFLLPSSLGRASDSFAATQLPCAHINLAPQLTTSNCILHAKNSGNHDGKESIEPGPLTVDILAIVVASQLIGLVDVLNDASFWENGGFSQPLPAVPATLDDFVQRTSSGCVCWILSTLLVSHDNWIEIPRLAKIIVAFVLLQFGLAFAVSKVMALSVDPLLLARDCYFVTIMITGFRYFYGKVSGV